MGSAPFLLRCWDPLFCFLFLSDFICFAQTRVFLRKHAGGVAKKDYFEIKSYSSNLRCSVFRPIPNASAVLDLLPLLSAKLR